MKTHCDIAPNERNIILKLASNNGVEDVTLATIDYQWLLGEDSMNEACRMTEFTRAGQTM